MPRVLIGLAVLALLLVGVDRAAELAAGWFVGERIADQTQVERHPSVDFRGFPFLTQAVRREFVRVDVELRGVRPQQQVRMDRLTAQLRDVRVLSGNQASAEAVTGRGMVAYRDLAAALNDRAEVAYGGDGLVKITRPMELLGRQTSVSAFGRPVVRDRVLVIRPERFESGVGPVDQVVGRVPLVGFDIRVPLRRLPEGIDVDLRPRPAGIDLQFSGENVLLEP